MQPLGRLLPALLLAAAALSAIPPQSAPAAETTAKAATIDLATVRSRALAASSSLKKAGIAVDAALLDQKAQGYAALPSLSARLGATASYPASAADPAGSVTATASLSASWTVWDGGKNALLSAIDRLATLSARQEARAALFSVLDAVDAAYFAVLEKRASVSAAASDLEAARANRLLVQAKRGTGQATRIDLLQADAAFASAKATLDQAEGALTVRRTMLSSLAGIPLSAEPEDIDFSRYSWMLEKFADFSGSDMEALVDRLLRTVLEGNPALLKSRLAGESAEASVGLARADWLPSLAASWSHSLSATGSGIVDATKGSLSLTATVPLDPWSASAAVASRKAEAERASLDAAEERRILNLELAQAAYDCAAQARSVLSSQTASEYSEAYRAGVREQYELSAASRTELAAADALAGSSRGKLAEARYGFLSALSALRSLGAFDSDDALLAALR